MEKIKFDHSKLRGRIAEKFGSQAVFVRHIDRCSSWLSNRLRGKVHFTDEDIYLLSSPENLDIPDAEIPAYFFTV
jgi:hypothetical protein